MTITSRGPREGGPSTTLSSATTFTIPSVELGIPDEPGLASHPPPHSSQSSHENTNESHASVQEFFAYKPKTLHKAKNHTKSTGTRGPALWDRHFDPLLRLLHVVYLPSITTDLMKIADDALEAARLRGNLPPLNDKFPTAPVRRKVRGTSSATKIVCEQQIETIYNETHAKFCSAVAATLEFQLPAWDPGHFRYTLERDKSQGIADGFLKIQKSEEGPCLSTPHALAADTFPTLAIWEFKSLTAGTIEVMEAIVQQTSSSVAFEWEGCDLGKTCASNAKHRGENGSPIITGSKTGYDAESPPCGTGEKLPAIAPFRPTCSTKPTSQTSAAQIAQQTATSRTSAAHITQQTWAEAVHDDATFVVIHAGNLEIIGIRNRKTQTLFITDVIRVDDCEYGKLHTGLYIAALRDATSRSLRLNASDPLPPSWTKSYNKRSSAKLKSADVLGQACLRDWLVMQRPKTMSIISFIPDAYHFRDNPSKPLMEQTQADVQSFFRIGVNAQFEPLIARGSLKVDGSQFIDTVIIKFAHTEESINKLRGEHDMYLALLHAGVTELPRIIGLFHHAYIEGIEFPPPSAVLVMEDVGRPVDQVSEEFTRGHLTSFQELLKKIHKAGVVHTKLSRSKLMIRNGEPGKVSIVSFGNAYKPGQGQASAFENEQKTLLALLPNPLKKSIDGEQTCSFKDSFSTPGTSNLHIQEDDGDSSPSPKKLKHTHRTPARRTR